MDSEKISEELSKIQVTLAELGTTVKMGFAQHADQFRSQTDQLKELNTKTELALLPIKLGKALVAIIGGASVIMGCIYGTYQFITGSVP